jgi:hypothetical protein
LGKFTDHLAGCRIEHRNGFVAGTERGFTANKISYDSHDVASLVCTVPAGKAQEVACWLGRKSQKHAEKLLQWNKFFK